MNTGPSAPQPDPQSSQGSYWGTSRPRLAFSEIRNARLKDYAVRFLFGGVISVLAALLGHWVTPRFGSLFTTFLAILLASLTLIGKKEGHQRSAQDAQGGVVGTLELLVTATFLSFAITLLACLTSLRAALSLWLSLSLLLHLFCVKVDWLRTSQCQEQQPDRLHPDQQ